MTSFEISTKKKIRAPCGCELCTYIVDAPNLQVRAPSKLDERIAGQVKLDCLERLVQEVGAPLFRNELDSFMTAHQELRRPLAIVAYVREIDRRSAYRGQGRPVLALWREIAWKSGRPDKKFELTSDEVLLAQDAIRNELRAVAS